MVAQAGADVADARAVQHTDGCVAQQGHDRRPLALMDQALVLAQAHILDPMQPVLDDPMPALEGEEPFWRPRLGREAGDAVVQGLLGCTVLAPGVPQADDLGQPRPVDIAVEVGRGDQMAHVIPPPMSAVDCARLTLVAQGQGRQATRASRAAATLNSASPFSVPCPGSIGSWARTTLCSWQKALRACTGQPPCWKGRRPRCALPSRAWPWTGAAASSAAGTGTTAGAKWAPSAAASAWPSSLLNRRCSVDWQGVRPAGKPSVRSRSGDWRAPHSAMASTERWLDSMAATARARSAGRA